MLSASYFAAAAAMFAATLYLFFRLRMFLTTTTMLVGSLLLIYGPAYLSFMLSSGEHGMLVRWLSGGTNRINLIFPRISGKVPDFDAVVIAMNFSIALMYVGIIAGIATVDRLIPNRISILRTSLTNWSAQVLREDVGGCKILFSVISVVALFMFFVSYKENHIGSIKHFLSLPTNDISRIDYRLHHGGSPNYIYNVILGAIAPMLVIWGLLASRLHRSWWLLLSATLLLLAVMIGKSDTLTKAAPAFFLIQLIVAALVTFTNRITWRSALGIACIVALVLYAVFRVILPPTEGLATVYSRVFEVENQSLLENFAAFPAMHPHMWGANLRPIAILMGFPHTPAFSIVAYTWYGNYEVTSPALFIADAWADFSYAGVIVFSVIAGAVCRSIDAIFLAHGKTVVAVAVLGAAFFGVFTLLVTGMTIAFVSGGLLLAPMLAGFLLIATRYFHRRRARLSTLGE
jgi:hypothetical protein